MLARPRDSVAANNETAISELRAQLSEGLARLDQLTVGLQAVQEFLWPMAPEEPGHEAASPATAAVPIQEAMAEPEPVLIQPAQVSSTWSMTGRTRSRASSRGMPVISSRS